MAVKISKKRLLSIVIKTDKILITELTKTGKQIKVHNFVSIDTPLAAVNDGAIENYDELAKAIKEALEGRRIYTNDVVFSIVSGKIATKEVELPDIKESKLAELINTNMSEYFPVNIEQYATKYSIIEKFSDDSGENKVKVQVVAAPLAIIDEYYHLAEKLGFNVVTIDYAGNSQSQILKHQITNEFSVVINIENVNSVISIFDNNVLKLQRNIPYGHEALIKAIMAEHNLKTESEAYEKLQDDKLLHISFDGDELTDSMAYLTNSINRVLDYYISRNGNRHFEKAYIIGSSTNINGFVQLMTNSLNAGKLIPIRKINDVEIEDPNPYKENRLTEYITNIGAMYAPLDLVQQAEKQKGTDTDKSKMVMWIILLAAVVISAAIVLVPLIQMLVAKNDLEDAREKLANMEDVQEIVDNYNDSIAMAADAYNFASLTVNSNDTIKNFVEQLEDKIPSDVAFSSLTVSSGSVSISGTASSKSSIAKLIQQLQTIDTVSNVYVNSESEAKDNNDVITATFSLTCTFTQVPEVEKSENAQESVTDEPVE